MSESNHFLQLERPVIFFDLETTGLNQEKDRIIELYAHKLFPDGTQQEIHHYFNPTIPIPADVTAIHGITNEFIADKPTFETLAGELAAFFEGADLAGFNLKKFDIPLLMCEFNRFDHYPIDSSSVKVIDSFSLYVTKERRDLSAAVKFYCGEDHATAHSAKADVLATTKVLRHQLLMYDDLEPSTTFLHDYTKPGNTVDLDGRFVRDQAGDILFNFGKHEGKLAKDHSDYLEWMIKGNFSFDSKMVARRILEETKWQAEIMAWLQKELILPDYALASALYTALKFKQNVHPFKLGRKETSLLVCYNKEVPSFLIIRTKEHKQVLIRILEKQIAPQSVENSRIAKK